jgi:chromosome segregation ATPase
MKKVKISVILSIAAFFLLALFAPEASALFDNKYKEASKKLEESEAARAKALKDVAVLEERCAVIEKANGALKEDRSNFLIRIKQLMDEKNQGRPAAEAVKEIESLKKENVELQKAVKEYKESVVKEPVESREVKKPKASRPAAKAAPDKKPAKPDEEKEDLKRENLSLKKELASLRSTDGQDARYERYYEETEFLKKENVSLKREVASLKESMRELPGADVAQEKAKELHEKLLSAQRESTRLNVDVVRLEAENERLKAARKEAESLKKDSKKMSADLKSEKALSAKTLKEKEALEKDKAALSAELKQFKKNYAEAVKKNKAFERDIKNMPKKFSELARQNIAMRKETSEMHYNLGVFYAKNKEYERAANEFAKTVDIDPEHAYAYFNLGYINAEYFVNRKAAIENFRHYLNLAKSDDKDAEWAKKYILTWQTWEGKQSID